ncbi:MAG: RluA family pseudouridine synthase [Clostridia bacterium]|nr:RluA family pseudouridine synthase [Clostridia bacterium]
MAESVRAGAYEIPVIYEDNHLLVVVKPANLPTQADSSGDDDLLSILKRYIGEKYNKPGAVYLGLVHRLDRPVGGVMVFARTSKAASRLSEAFRTHEQDRRYLAVIEGEVRENMELTDYLLKDGKTGMVRVVKKDAPGAKQARLISRPIAARNGLTLSHVQLFTGRAHQIRVQHAHAGHPLWGDMRYGHGMPGRQIALWACELTLDHPTKHESLRFTSAPSMKGAWKDFEGEIKTLLEL